MATTINHGPCPHCATGQLTQFPGSIDAVCAPAAHDTKCQWCNKRIDRCATATHQVGGDTCPWPASWSCGYWRQADKVAV